MRHIVPDDTMWSDISPEELGSSVNICQTLFIKNSPKKTVFDGEEKRPWDLPVSRATKS